MTENNDKETVAVEHKEFWAGAASGSSRKMLAKAQRWLDRAKPSRIMINYQTKMSERDARWRDYDLMVDPGAYSLFAPSPIGQGNADYPQATETYLHDIGRLQPERYVWRDYVCEEDVREHHGVTVEEQQERTTERHIECANLHDDLSISATPMAVVQGWDPEDYRRHAQDLADHDLVTERIGIGTMCGRDNTNLCEEIVAAVRDVIPDVDLHAFGLDRAAYRSEYLIDELKSTDSLAYCHQYNNAAGWVRWEYVLEQYLRHRREWDAATGGGTLDHEEGPAVGQMTLADGEVRDAE